MADEMTAEEAVRELKILREEYWNDDGYGHETQQYDDTITAIDIAIKALEQQQDVHDTCKKCIEFSEFEKRTKEQPCIEDYPTCTECEHYDKDKHYCPRFCQVVKDALAEAQPKKGKWIVISCEPTDIFKCSECGMRVINPYRYCHNCGARMEVEDEDSN